ncbi:MAG: hypothetical protein KI792_00645 [Alphaproteobacteria bacterium]|nr:hypothetical protein [Alphaproteobacteria bacterium SS10]
MAQALASGPHALDHSMAERLRKVLTTTNLDRTLKEPVRRAARSALGVLDNKSVDWSVEGVKAGVHSSLHAVSTVKSVLSTIAGALEDTGRPELARKTSRLSSRFARLYKPEREPSPMAGVAALKTLQDIGRPRIRA